MIRKKRIAVFTGKRGGSGALTKIMNGIKKSPYLEMKLIISDMHLSTRFGKTENEINKFFKIDKRIYTGEYGDKNFNRTRALAKIIDGMDSALKKLKPDILLLLGDRGETLAAAISAVEMGIVVAHIQAGDISGGIDDIHRHSITKLAHLHFSQNEKQRKRVIKLGELKKHVWNTGAPYIDNIFDINRPKKDKVLKKIGLNANTNFFLILQHSDTYRQNLSYLQMKEILSAAIKQDEKAIVFYPCSDPGYNGIIKAINKFKNNKNIKIFKSIEFPIFLTLLENCSFLIGNSSAGIIEAPYFHTPFINIGLRQIGRERGNNVIDCEPNKIKILKTIDKIKKKSFQIKMKKDKFLFGDGNASKKIVEILEKINLTKELFQKKIQY